VRANTFGFYTLNGVSVADFYDNSKKESVCLFLGRVRELNPEGRIVMLLDNFSSHHAEATIEYAEMLDIQLVFLTPYSPDLNPIEYIWKDVKKEVSTTFITCKEAMRELIAGQFNELSESITYARAWIATFLTPIGISIKR
jgi:transposase